MSSKSDDEMYVTRMKNVHRILDEWVGKYGYGILGFDGWHLCQTNEKTGEFEQLPSFDTYEDALSFVLNRIANTKANSAVHRDGLTD